MIKDLSLGEPTIYIGGKKVEGVTNVSSLDLDLATGEDKTSVTVCDKGSINYEVSFSLSAEDNPISKWLIGMFCRFKRERKALKWALTHGYIIHILVETENGDHGYYELTKPSELNRIIRYTKFIPTYRIYDRYKCKYRIRKGKIVPFRLWPVTPKILEEYEKKLKKYHINEK